MFHIQEQLASNVRLDKNMKFILNLFNGRINRRNYALGWTSATVIFYILVFLFSFLGEHIFSQLLSSIILIIVFLASIIFDISLHIRRFHDQNMSGWMSLLFFVPLVNFVLILFLLFAKGTKGVNKYGEEPSDSIRYPKDILNIKEVKKI